MNIELECAMAMARIRHSINTRVGIHKRQITLAFSQARQDMELRHIALGWRSREARLGKPEQLCVIVGNHANPGGGFGYGGRGGAVSGAGGVGGTSPVPPRAAYSDSVNGYGSTMLMHQPAHVHHAAPAVDCGPSYDSGGSYDSGSSGGGGD